MCPKYIFMCIPEPINEREYQIESWEAYSHSQLIKTLIRRYPFFRIWFWQNIGSCKIYGGRLWLINCQQLVTSEVAEIEIERRMCCEGFGGLENLGLVGYKSRFCGRGIKWPLETPAKKQEGWQDQNWMPAHSAYQVMNFGPLIYRNKVSEDVFERTSGIVKVRSPVGRKCIAHLAVF